MARYACMHGSRAVCLDIRKNALTDIAPNAKVVVPPPPPPPPPPTLVRLLHGWMHRIVIAEQSISDSTKDSSPFFSAPCFPSFIPFSLSPPPPVCYTPLFFPPSSHVRLVNFSRDLSFIIRCLFDSNRIFSWNFPSIDYTPIFIIPENRVFSWPEKYFEIFKVVKHEIIAYQYR